MQNPKREYKNDIKYKITLNEEQKEAKRLILDNQIVVITGQAGSGKSLICANVALDFLLKKQVDNVLITRATIEVGKSLGYLPGGLEQKFNPYIEAFKDNLYALYEKEKIDKFIEDEKIKAEATQFVRGKTFNDLVILEESQNFSKGEMLALLTRLGKTGKIIINGDNAQKDIRDAFNGLSYIIELSKKIPEIKHIKLKENHRSDLVGKILDYEYGNI